MTKTTAQSGKRGSGHGGHIRPIKTKRDFEGSHAVVKRLKKHPERDSSAELRLQSLLKEMDKFDDVSDDDDDNLSDESMYPGPRRRWSDDGVED